METLLEFPSIVGIEVGVAYSANESMETDFEGIPIYYKFSAGGWLIHDALFNLKPFIAESISPKIDVSSRQSLCCGKKMLSIKIFIGFLRLGRVL